MEPFIEELVSRAGPWLLPLLGMATLIEYVFPPFPGDTVMLLGALLAVEGEVSPWALMAVTTAGSVAGIVIDYRVGMWLQRRLEHPVHERPRRLIDPAAVARMEQHYRRWGPWFILANRFLPVARAVFFVFAGMSRLPLRQTIGLGVLSSALWNGMLIGVAVLVGENRELIEQVLRRYTRLSVAALAVVLLVALGVWLWRRRRVRPGPDA